MNLNVSEWKFFFLKDLCQISMGNKLDYINMTKDEPSINFIGRAAGNNGVADKVDLITGIIPYHKGCITVALGGSLGSAYLQTEDFYTSQNVAVLFFEEEISDNAKMFLTTSIMNESKYKYFPFGRELNTHIRTDFGFALPIKRNADGTPVIDITRQYSAQGYIPDWEFMDQYIRNLHHKPLTTKNKCGNVMPLALQTWKEFRIGDIFRYKTVKHYSAVPETEGMTPFVSSTSNNNGIAAIVEADSIEGNCITVSTNGDCFDCFFHSDPIAISNDVEALYNPKLNQYNAMFIITVMRLEKQKYGYGRKPKNNKVYNTVIKLPSTKNGQPDYRFMEDYIKSLPYGDRL